MMRFWWGGAVIACVLCATACAGLPVPVMAGYLDVTAVSSANQVSLSDAKSDGYNTLIIAFASVDGTQVSFGSSYQHLVTAKMAEAKQANMTTLLSFGGQANTFKPGDLSESELQELATHLVAFVTQYGFDGIDFDLEVPTDPSWLHHLIQTIKTEAKQAGHSLIITAAPQINDGMLVTTGHRSDYSEAIAHDDFDALFLQAYNTPPQNEVSFISSSFDQLKAQVPQQTKLVIGEPTDAVAAGSVSLYHPAGGSQPLSTEAMTASMLPELALIREDPQWGGVMGWSLNVDYDASAYGNVNHVAGSFAHGLRDCVMSGQCDTPPEPKPKGVDYILEISNLGKQFGMTVDLFSHGESVFESDYIKPKGAKSYGRRTYPSLSSLEGLENITVVWKTYTNVPIYCGTLALTVNQHVMVNPDTQACEIKQMP